MRTKDFWYDLPEELIAQTPLLQRDASRLCVLDRQTGRVDHKHFYDILDYLQPGDCLIMNDSRVLPARIWATSAGNACVSPEERCSRTVKSPLVTVSLPRRL